jgi:tyrosinase
MWLGYDYSNDKPPSALPPNPIGANSSFARSLSTENISSTERPALTSFTAISGREIAPNRRSVSGCKLISFDERSRSLRLNINRKDAEEFAALVAARRTAPLFESGEIHGAVKLVIDGVSLSRLGLQGGYFYAMYVNMPSLISSYDAHAKSFLGTLGAFQVASASHHGPAPLEFDLLSVLAQQAAVDLSQISLSWVRINGDSVAKGAAIDVREVRVDIVYESSEVELPRLNSLPGTYNSSHVITE